MAQKLARIVATIIPKKIKMTKLVDFNLAILLKANPRLTVVNKM